MASLEEFIIFGNASDENLEKLRNLNGARHAAKSLASTDAQIVVRALCLGAQLTKGSEKASEDFLSMGSINYIVEYLNSSNESFRVEALQVLENISEFQIGYQVFTKFQILTRVIILLEEGLQTKTDAGIDQATSTVKILRNFAKISPKAT